MKIHTKGGGDENDEIPERITRTFLASWEEVGPEDRMLFTMKEAGESWQSIREAWKGLTGTETGKSTLPNRYSRIKGNLEHLAEGDVPSYVTFFSV